MASELSDEQLRELYARATAARRDPGRVACPTPDALLAAVRREGSEQRRLAVIDHAMSCADCRQDFELLRAIEASRRADAGAEVAHIRWRRPLGVALAASVALVAALTVWQRSERAGAPDVLRGNGPAVATVAPLPDATLAAGPLAFTWHAVPGARRYVVELLNAQGAVSASRETTDTTATLGDARLVAGEYTWWVRAQLDGGENRSAARRLRIDR